MESDVETVPSTSNDMPELESVTSTSCSGGSDSFDNADFEEGDWFSHGNISSPILTEPMFLDISEDILVAMEPAKSGKSSYVRAANRAEVYNSGCTKHISPYRDDLHNYTEIQPKYF